MGTDDILNHIRNYLSPDKCLQYPLNNALRSCSVVQLKELKNEGKQNTLDKLRLTYVPSGVLFYAIDDALETPYPSRGKSFKHPKVFSNLVKQLPGVHSPCDYVIFAPHHHTVNVILCDMKSQKIGECHPKMLATRCFIDYVKSLISNFEVLSVENREIDFKYSNILVHLSRNTTQGTLNKRCTHPSVQSNKNCATDKENDIHRCPVGPSQIRDHAFEISWTYFLQKACIE